MKILISILIFPSFLLAAPHSTTVDDQVARALREPHTIAINRIKNVGSEGHSRLMQLAFSDKWPMKTRWKSFMLLTLSQGNQSLPVIKKALLDKVWYMRSAGLTALQSIEPQGAKKWAYKMLNSDPALMVRMKALEVLSHDRSEKVTELFWKKVYSADSLYREKSLWIREDLARLLLRQPREKDLQRWVRMLHDSDKQLQGLASQALEKLHDRNLVETTSVSYWQEKYPSQNL